MCTEGNRAPGVEAALAGIDARLARLQREVAGLVAGEAEGERKDGAVYLALLEVTRELGRYRVLVEGMKVMFHAGRADLLATQEAARERVPAIRLIG